MASAKKARLLIPQVHQRQGSSAIAEVPIDPELLESIATADNTNNESANGRDPSITSEEDVRTALLPKAVEIRGQRHAHDINHDSLENSAEQTLRDVLGDITRHCRVAIRAGEDKVALSTTAFNWVGLKRKCQFRQF